MTKKELEEKLAVAEGRLAELELETQGLRDRLGVLTVEANETRAAGKASAERDRQLREHLERVPDACEGRNDCPRCHALALVTAG